MPEGEDSRCDPDRRPVLAVSNNLADAAHTIPLLGMLKATVLDDNVGQELL